MPNPLTDKHMLPRPPLGRTARGFLSILLVFLFLTRTDAETRIFADNPNWQYVGRVDFSHPREPRLFWPGTYIRANFAGTSLTILLDDRDGKSAYDIFIDRDFDHPYRIDCAAGRLRYPVTRDLADTLHSLLIFRRTEAATGPTAFLGAILDAGKTLMPPPPPRTRRIEFYGNSITCGMANEAPDGAPEDDLSQENNFLAYGAITARELDADYTCIAKSGIGILVSWFPLTMPEYYARLNPEEPGSRWDFSRYRPDVVVVNLFQNDSWLIARLDPVPDARRIINAYAAFIRQLRARYPQALIICALGNMDATRDGSPWPGYIRQAVRQLRRTNHDRRIETLFFPYSGYPGHPRVRHHRAMAKQLVAFIRAKTGWK